MSSCVGVKAVTVPGREAALVAHGNRRAPRVVSRYILNKIPGIKVQVLRSVGCLVQPGTTAMDPLLGEVIFVVH